MKPGMVLFCKNFVFEDGTHKNKLFIILSHPRDNICLAVKTTSQKKWRDDKKEGCNNKDGYFFVKGSSNNKFFEEDTWVIMEQVLLFKCENIKAALDSGDVIVITNLAAPFVGELRNCLKSSDDISEEQLAYLK